MTELKWNETDASLPDASSGMVWSKVESSQITEVGYDAYHHLLGIRFPAGKRSPASEYHYSDVPADIYRALVAAPSVGSYFGSEIKANPARYPYAKVGETLPPEPEQPVGSALALIDHMTPEEIFIPGTMDKISETGRVERHLIGRLTGETLQQWI